MRPQRAPRRLGGALAVRVGHRAVLKKMVGLVEAGGQPTVEELLKKLDEGQEEEEEEQVQEEQGE